MERNHVLGMVCGYYLSRYDVEAYESLGFEDWKAAYESIGRALGVPAGSIRNWRDEFDPVHDNPRKGWHRRPMAPSRIRMIESLGDYTRDELRALVVDAIATPRGPSAERYLSIATNVDEAD